MSLWISTTSMDMAIRGISSGGVGYGGSTDIYLTINTTQPLSKTDATSTATRIAKSTAGIVNFDSITWSTLNVTGSYLSTGRALGIQQTSDLDVTSSGKASHVCLMNNNRLLFVTKCTTRLLQGTDTVTVPAWKIHIMKPGTSTGYS
jgi:hypothetical protein